MAEETFDFEQEVFTLTDEDGNAVTQINAYQVYVLELYAENTNMYTIGNFVAEGMTTYFGDVSYEEYVA